MHVGDWRNCAKRVRKARTYSTATLAVQEAKAFYLETRQKMFIYRCRDQPCRSYGHIHWTTAKKSGPDFQSLNKKLLDFYTHHEQFGTGALRRSTAASARAQRMEQNRLRKKKIRKQLPFLTWEDDGGALHPRDLED